MKGSGAGRRPTGNRWRPSVLFWLLVALSIVAIGAGLARLQAARVRLAEESRPSASGPTRSLAPDFTLQAVSGDMLRLSDLKGQVVLLNFWATWCPPCKAEMPDLQALHEEFGREQGFTVIGIDLQEESTPVAAFAAENGITFPLLLDTEGEVTNGLFGVRSLPTSMIIDRDGHIRDAWTGRISRAAMSARLDRIW